MSSYPRLIHTALVSQTAGCLSLERHPESYFIGCAGSLCPLVGTPSGAFTGSQSDTPRQALGKRREIPDIVGTVDDVGLPIETHGRTVDRSAALPSLVFAKLVGGLS